MLESQLTLTQVILYLRKFVKLKTLKKQRAARQLSFSKEQLYTNNMYLLFIKNLCTNMCRDGFYAIWQSLPANLIKMKAVFKIEQI